MHDQKESAQRQSAVFQSYIEGKEIWNKFSFSEPSSFVGELEFETEAFYEVRASLSESGELDASLIIKSFCGIEHIGAKNPELGTKPTDQSSPPTGVSESEESFLGVERSGKLNTALLFLLL